MPHEDKSNQSSETPLGSGETAKKQSKLFEALALYPVLNNIARRAHETPDALQQEDPKADPHMRGFLEPKDQYALASTCTTLFKSFKEGREARIGRVVANLLQWVAYGEQDKVEKLLVEIPAQVSQQGRPAKPKLLMARGDVTDPSGRVFKNLTAFEYALWAMDTHMIRMMLDSLPQDEKGNAVRVQLLEQYEKVTALLPIGGVEYTFKGESHRENHFNFEPLKAALKTYIDQYTSWSDDQIVTHWRSVVGGAQADVPMHVAQEYCRPQGLFAPIPKFNETEKLHRGMPMIYNRSGNVMGGWFTHGTMANQRLGRDFGVILGWERSPLGASHPWHHWAPRTEAWVDSDSKAMAALCEVRTTEIIDLRRRLQEPLPKPDAEATCSCVVQ